MRGKGHIMEMVLTFHFIPHRLCVCMCEVCTINYSKEYDEECLQYTPVIGVCVSFRVAVSTFSEKQFKVLRIEQNYEFWLSLNSYNNV